MSTSFDTLPAPRTPLVGRDPELRQVMQMIEDDARLVTITGIGGIGKTRLAIHAALELEPEFHHGAVMVPLAHIRDAQLIPAEIARTLGRPDATADDLTAMFPYESILMILDNLEQIPDADKVIDRILAGSESVHLLCTSQIPLNLERERVFSLGPMEMPVDPEENSAVMLFTQRAMAADDSVTFDEDEIGFISDICMVLEGIPLAIELAAARTPVLPPQAILARLTARFDILSGSMRSAPDRHQTMSRAIAWSYDLLSDEEQQVFRCLGVWPGSISESAIKHLNSVLGIDIAAGELLQTLVSRSLLRPVQNDESSRYQMLQTLREYGIDQLDNRNETDAAHEHLASYIVALAEKAEPHLGGPDQVEWFQKLAAEQENITQVCRWSAETDPVYLLRVIAAIWRFFQLSYLAIHYSELGHRVPVENIKDTELVARALLAIGSLDSTTFTNIELALATLQSASQYADQLDNHRIRGRAHNAQGGIHRHLGDLETARWHYEEALRLALLTGVESAEFVARANLALIAFDHNDCETAIAQMEQVLPLAQRFGDDSQISRARMSLGIFNNRLERFDIAAGHLEASLHAAREHGNVSDEFFCIMNLINSAIGSGNLDRAEELYREGLEINRQSHNLYDELCLRAVMLEIPLNQLDIEKIANEVHIMASGAINTEFRDVIITAAGASIAIALHRGRYEGVAELLGGFDTWSTKLRRLNSVSMERILTRAREVISTSLVPSVPVAYERAKQWDLQQLCAAALYEARSYIHLRPDANAPRPVSAESAPPNPDIPLTPREHHVLKHLATGQSNAHIAEMMYISPRTVSSHVSNILYKLDVENRAAAVAKAITQGWIQPGGF